MKKFVSFVLGFMCVSLSSVKAGVLKDIKVVGNERIHSDMIKNFLSIKIGDEVNEKVLNKNLNILYRSGFFNNIKIDENDGVLVIKVSENPVINSVALEGNSSVKDDDLKKGLQTRSRAIFSPATIKQDVENIKTMYKRLGYFKASVDAKVIKKNDNRYDVVFEINEGDKAFIKKIEINGNESFSSSQLQDVIMSKEYAWWKFMEMFDTYDEDRILYDTELLRNYYVSQGFLDFEVVSYTSKMDLSEKNFFVKFNLKEGKRYKVGNVSINSQIPDLNIEKLQKKIILPTGILYDENLAKKSVSALASQMGEDGFAFVDIEIIRKPNKETGVVDVIFDIQNSSKAFINKIEIKNNTRTYENVIRRNLAFDEQDIFNSNKLKQSEQNLMGLGYFDNVKFVPKPVAGTPDKVNVDVNVQEKSTGELSLGAGWSSINKGFFEFGIKETNFMGKGQTLGFTSTFSGRQNNFSLSFVEPYLFDRDLMGGVDAYYNQYKYSSTYGYDINGIGLALKLGWSYTDKLYHRLRFSAKNEKMTNIADNLPNDLRVGIGEYNVFKVGQTLTFKDQFVDYVNDTKNGYVISLSNEYAGFGGDKYFVKNDLSFKQSFSFWDNEWMFGILVDAGKIHSLNEKVLSRSDRYLLGGDSLRGFEYGGIGARNKLNPTYAYGGDWVVNGTFQLNFPIGIPKKYKISGYIFYDWGKLGSPDLKNDEYIMYSGKIRTSAGYGILWNSPIGAINLSWSKALEYEDYDELQRFRFSIGSSF